MDQPTKKYIKCTNSVEACRAISEEGTPEIYGSDYFDFWGDYEVIVREGSPTIHVGGPTIIKVFGSSTPVIIANLSGEPIIETYDNSSPVISSFYGNHPTLIAHDHSTPLCTARVLGNVSVKAYDFSKVSTPGPNKVLESSKTATIRYFGHPLHLVEGDAKVLCLDTDSPIDWVNFFELQVVDEDYVYLYKALDQDFCARYMNFRYLPGTVVEAPDWDPTIECGGGLHFSPTPQQALTFNTFAEKFVACKVKLSEMIVHSKGIIPEKVKAPRVYEIFEVDLNGQRV